MLEHWPPLPYLCAPSCHPLCLPTNRPWPQWSLSRTAERPVSQCNPTSRCISTMEGDGAQPWAEEGMRQQGAGDQNSLCRCCCQRIRFVEVWLHRSAGSVHLALGASLLSTPFHVALIQDFGYRFSSRKEGPSSYLAKYRICEVEGAMVQSSDWRCEIDLPKLHGDHTVCVLLTLQYICSQAYICI